MVHTSTSDEYLAGLWRKDIEKQLLWFAKSPSTEAKYFAYRAPSWSWASNDGAIEIPDGIDQKGTRITVIETQMAYTDSGMFSQC